MENNLPINAPLKSAWRLSNCCQATFVRRLAPCQFPAHVRTAMQMMMVTRTKAQTCQLISLTHCQLKGDPFISLPPLLPSPMRGP